MKQSLKALPKFKRFEQANVTVVGGGIVGLATAREVLQRFPKFKVYLLEREKRLAMHQTSHNSGVIHAGMYYKPGSAMARCCVEGAKKMYRYCEENHLPHRRIGKLIVATKPEELPILEELLQRGRENGVEDLEILTREQVLQLEPNVDALGALNSPNTGIVDYEAVALQLAKDIEKLGGIILTNFHVKRIKLNPCDIELYGDGDNLVLSDYVITCAGTHSDTTGQLSVAGYESQFKAFLKATYLLGGSKKPAVLPFRGSYYEMKPGKENICTRNIYPVPNTAGIPVGIHFTPTTKGKMIIGPGACLALHRDGYKFFDFSFKDFWTAVSNPALWKLIFRDPMFTFNEIRKDLSSAHFLRDAKKLIPSLKLEDTQHSFSGVMAQVLDDSGRNANEFIFESHDYVLNVRNAPSPACTASLHLAKEIVDKAAADFQWKE